MKNSFSKTINKLSKHYENLFKKHKYSVKSNQQSSIKTQYRRFDQIVNKINFKKNSSILDFGCGTGSLLKYLKIKKKFHGYYHGIDIAENMIISNKKFYKGKNIKFTCQNILKKRIKKKYDFIFVNGVFNNLTKDNWRLMKKILIELFKITKQRLVFNNLSTYVDYKDKNLFYIPPERVLSFCKKQLSNYVFLDHSYKIKENTIPYEFTTTVLKRKP